MGTNIGAAIKKGLSFLFVVVLVAMQGACTPAPAEAAPEIRDYRDIPGVTGEEIAAIEALREQGAAFVYGMIYSTEAFFDDDGAPCGYAALLCDWMSELFGIPFRMELYELDDLVEGLEAGDIHFTGDLSPSQERIDKYRMSGSMAHRLLRRVRLRGMRPIQELRAERQLRYAVLKNSATYSLLQSSEAEPFQVLFADTHQQGIEMMERGEADGLLVDNTAEAMFFQNPEVVFEDFSPIIYKPKTLTTADDTLAPIISVMDKFIEADSERFLLHLYDQGYLDYKQYAFRQTLNEDEKAYIDRRALEGGISVLYEYDNYPISFFNETEGEFQGITVDVLEAVSEITGLPLDVAEGQVAWSDVQRMLTQGDVDIVSELIISDDRIGKYVWPESTNMLDKFVLVSLTDSPHSTIGDVISSRVGIIEATRSALAFRSWFPDHEHVTVYPYNEAAFDALEAGEVDLLMVTQKMLLSYSNYKERPLFKASMVLGDTYESKFGLRKGNETLASIIDKAVRFIDTDTIADEWNLRVFNYQKRMYQMQIPYLTAFCIFLACTLALACVVLLRHRSANRHLEQTVQERTKDLTLQKRELEIQAEELEIQTQAAQAASKAKGEFLARMSHEIRTPLNAIIGMTQIARMSAEHSDTHRTQLDETLKASTHLLDIINDVLDMSKIESGKMTMLSEPFNLFTAMNEVVSIFQHRCDEKNIDFYAEYQGLESVHVVGDRLHLKQVLINLLGNAVKFTEDCGKVQFKAEAQTETEDRIQVVFSVRDTGIGVTEEQAARLFGMFEQADGTISGRFGGSGLGLAISQYLVGKMGGKIQLESEYGSGSNFYFTLELPKTDALEDQADGTGQGEALDLTGKHILLAEDIEINRTILIELLRDTHVIIDEAEDGWQVVEMFENAPAGYYDLIFMDVQMPNMNGYEATGLIRGLPHPDAATIPIIAMTANAYTEDVAREKAAGMTGHISKPIDIVIVKNTLSSYLLGPPPRRGGYSEPT